LPAFLLGLTLDPAIAELVLGDLQEEFALRAAEEGRPRASRWYWKQAITSSTNGRRSLTGFPGPKRPNDNRNASMIDSLLNDVRLTLRSFANNRGFVAVAVITLALGIGTTTGVFSLANWLMLRPVPGVAAQGRLVSVNLGIRRDGGLRVASLSYPNFEDFAARLTQVEAFAGVQGGSINASVGTEGAVGLAVKYVTASYADVLGLTTQLGRWFTEEEDDPAATAHVVVLGESTWKSMYGGDPDVVGRDLLVNGRPFEIIGVAAKGFEGAYLNEGTEAWLPGSSYPWASHYDDVLDYAQRGAGGFYEFVARLADGATAEQSQDELSAASSWLAERYPEDNDKFAPKDGSEAVTFLLYPGIGTHPLSRPYVTSTLRLMLGAVALVLLIACANVANLLLVRGMRRAGELAVRKSLGAGRWRLLRQQLTEGVLLWLIGGGAGLGVALILMRSFAGVEISGASVGASIPLDMRVLTFVAGLSLLTGLAFSLLPAWMVAGIDAARTLQSGNDESRGRKNRARLVFGAAQIAASLTLLVGAMLFARTIVNVSNVDPGIDPTDITAAFVYPTDIGYSVEEAAEYFEQLRQELDAHPGTSDVVLTSNVPFYGFKSYGRARAADDIEGEYLQPLALSVSESYFEMLSIPLLRGRAFTPDEVRAGTHVMIISETLAATLFGDREPLGLSIEVPAYSSDPTFYEVVGVVADTRYRDLTEAPEPTYFTPRGGGLNASRAVVMVETLPGANGQEVLRSAIAKVSPSLAPGRVESLEQAVRDATAQPRMLARLLMVLSAVAATLAAVGLYGMVSTTTAQRTFEMGIRLALGSTPRRILGLVLAGTASVAGLGIAGGLLGAWWLSRAIESRLFGVARLDPLAWIGAVSLLVVVAFVAALVPAWRASRLDPVETLRCR
jgi:predicted permease